jgi:MYXO-CTERM domain-containing protein
MTIRNITKTTLLAIVTTAITASAGNAALSFTNDDLFLAFRQDGNNVKDYVIDIGQASIYRDATSNITLNLSGLAADLGTAFGGNLSNVSWGVVGGTQNTAGTAPDNLTRLLYVSEPTGAVPTALSSQSGAATNIVNLKNYFLTLTASQGTVSNSAFGDPTQPNSWSTRISNAFGFSNLSPIEGPLGSSLDLFRVPQTTSGQPVTNEGAFSFNSGTSTVTFSVPGGASPVPEPSTALFGALSLGAMAFRRRRAASSLT